MKRPLVSILVSAFNSEKYLREALDSALAQTYPNIEVVVIDPGSTDRTGEIAQSYADPRIRYERHGYEPIVRTRNELIKAARGEFVTFLDSDDIYLPAKVEREVAFLESQPDYAAVYCDLRYFFDGAPEKLYRHRYTFHSGEILPQLLEKMFITNTAFMFRREVLARVPGYDESLGLVEDWDFFLKMAHAGFKIGFLPEDLVRYRLRWDSHTNFAKQVPIQESAVRIFEGLKSRMAPAEREKYHIDDWLARRKSRLAIALFSQGERKKALHVLGEAVRQSSGKFRYLPLFPLAVLPTFLLRTAIERLWQRKKVNLFVPER